MLKLVIGNKNYSSWSMRPWVLMTQAAIPFEEVQIWLAEPDTAAQIARYSPSGTVPVLLDGAHRIWDSLAICEYLAEKFPEQHLWPCDPALRAIARAVSAEMHSGFSALRSNMPMNIRNRYPGKGMNAGVAAEVARMIAIWSECIGRSGGPHLFGDFCIADAMFTPVVFRLRTYGVTLDGSAAQYAERMLTTPALAILDQLAAAEGHAQARYDAKYT